MQKINILECCSKHVSIITNTNVLGKKVKQFGTDYNYCKLSANFKSYCCVCRGKVKLILTCLTIFITEYINSL